MYCQENGISHILCAPLKSPKTKHTPTTKKKQTPSTSKLDHIFECESQVRHSTHHRLRTESERCHQKTDANYGDFLVRSRLELLAGDSSDRMVMAEWLMTTRVLFLLAYIFLTSTRIGQNCNCFSIFRFGSTFEKTMLLSVKYKY